MKRTFSSFRFYFVSFLPGHVPDSPYSWNQENSQVFNWDHVCNRLNCFSPVINHVKARVMYTLLKRNSIWMLLPPITINYDSVFCHAYLMCMIVHGMKLITIHYPLQCALMWTLHKVPPIWQIIMASKGWRLLRMWKIRTLEAQVPKWTKRTQGQGTQTPQQRRKTDEGQWSWNKWRPPLWWSGCCCSCSADTASQGMTKYQT